jgi:hypothetical protein
MPIELKVKMASGRVEVATMEVEVGEIMESFSIIIDDAPVVIQPLFYHKDSPGYHTICRRLEDESPDVIEGLRF